MAAPVMLPRLKDVTMWNIILNPRATSSSHDDADLTRSRLLVVGEEIINLAVIGTLFDMYPMASGPTLQEYRQRMLTPDTLSRWARRHDLTSIVDVNSIDTGTPLHDLACARIFQAYTAAVSLEYGNDMVSHSIRTLARRWQLSERGTPSPSTKAEEMEIKRDYLDIKEEAAYPKEDRRGLSVEEPGVKEEAEEEDFIAFPLDSDSDEDMEPLSADDRPASSSKPASFLPPYAAFHQMATQAKKDVGQRNTHVGSPDKGVWTVELLLDNAFVSVASGKKVREARDAAALIALRELNWT